MLICQKINSALYILTMIYDNNTNYAGMTYYGKIIPHLQLAHIGDSAHFYCDSQTRPVWLKAGSEPSNAIYIMESIVLESVTQDDSGIYECEGTSHDGEDFNAFAELAVGS